MPNELLTWLQQPFSPDMPAWRWFAFVGLMIVMLYGWHAIYRELGEMEG